MYENGFYSDPSVGSNISGTDNGKDYYQTSNQVLPKGEIPNVKEKEKKRSGFLKKAMLSISLGLFFGLFAGIGFYAVQQTTGLLDTHKTGEAALSQNIQNNNPVLGKDESQSGIKLTNTEDIRVISSDISDVVSEVMPAMVSIVNNFTETGNIFGQNYSKDAASSGSGIIVGESETELLIVSNYHVVADATTLDVTFIDGSEAQAQIKGTDSKIDLAIVAIPLSSLSEETKEAIAIAALGDSENLKLGQPVIAIGNALGYGQSVTNGIVSALNREISLEGNATGNFIQTNAAINLGNSGGALLNTNGEVVGINSAKIGGSIVEGMGYAIPISEAKPIITDLMLKETRHKVENNKVGYLGITRQTITAQFSEMYNMPEGIYVTSVEKGSPANLAGMLPGDIIVKFDGNRISSDEEFLNLLQYYEAGTTVTVYVKRPVNGEYEQVELNITLGERPENLGY